MAERAGFEPPIRQLNSRYFSKTRASRRERHARVTAVAVSGVGGDAATSAKSGGRSWPSARAASPLRRNRPFAEPRLPGPTPRTGNRRSRENPGLSGGAIRLVGAVPGAGRRGLLHVKARVSSPSAGYMRRDCRADSVGPANIRAPSRSRGRGCTRRLRSSLTGPTKRFRRAAIDKGVPRSIACVRLAL